MCHHHVEDEPLREYLTERETEDSEQAKADPEPVAPADD
jgi:hypothetical protein